MTNDAQDALIVTPDLAQPRIRHITSFQIRNLSPFPLRDSAALAITKPAQQSQFTPYGQHADDLDITLSKKRTRKISSNSAATRRSTKSEAGDQNGTSPVLSTMFGGRERKSSIQKTEFVEGPSVRRYPSSRQRATSLSIPEFHSTSTSAIMIPDTSQEALENVVNARLVESRLVVSVFRPQHKRKVSQQEKTPASTTAMSKSKQRSGSVQSITSKVAVGRYKGEKLSPRREMTRGNSVKSNGTTKVVTHVRSLSPATIRRSDFPATKPLGLKADGISGLETYATYTSPIHRPSTNPTFPFDVNILGEDPSYFVGNTFRLEIWGRLADRLSGTVRDKGKEKQREYVERVEWNVIGSWDIDLEKLLPLPDDAEFQAYLPPNTLLVTLSPLGQVYYLPQGTDVRSQSPTLGYSSEPESEIQIHKVEENKKITSAQGSRKRRRRHSLNRFDAQVVTTTATWQDLSKLVCLHSQVEDAITSLLNVQSEIERDIKVDVVACLRYEEQERRIALQDLKDDYLASRKSIREMRERISQCSKDIEERRHMLSSVKEQCVDARCQQTVRDVEIVKQREGLECLRRRTTATRVTRLLTLASLFPIELYSPPDLLYTILDVPLPIPLSQHDPAPPLSMSTHHDVTEETVATALGYVAQVAQLIAAYLGAGLVYPVVCIGSRSLIRDNISAMVGPRIFPLFSKGVDSYRFEYGVFLLNKNIDMLMMDRDLRALDKRHTLPNLKNLMLTLTHGEGIQLPSMDSLSISLKDLALSADSEVASTTPKGGPRPLTPDAGSPSASASGATTPIAASTVTDTAKSARPLLGLSSLTDFIRLRYPSSHRGTSSDESEEAKNTVESLKQDGSDAGDYTTRQDTQQGNAQVQEGQVVEDKVPYSSVPTAMVLVPNVHVD